MRRLKGVNKGNDKKVYMKDKSTKIVYIKDVKAEVVFKRVKSLRLTVYPDGRVVLTVPAYTSIEKGVDFALSKYDWLVKKVNQCKSKPVKKDRKYIDGETFYVLGKKYVLSVKASGENSAFLDESEHTFVVKTSKLTQKNIKKEVEDFYLSGLKRAIETLMPKWLNITGLAPSTVNYKNLKSVWGKCDYKTREITFALQLFSRSVEEIEYVIMHELCHLAVPNHGKEFKTLESKFMPYWKEMKRKLKTNTPEYTTVL